jgi:hypothetical protein
VVRQREDVESVTVGLLRHAQQVRHLIDAAMRAEAEDDFLSGQCVLLMELMGLALGGTGDQEWRSTGSSPDRTGAQSVRCS